MSAAKENEAMLEKLLRATSAGEILSLIKKEDFFKVENCNWVPYGGHDLNVRQVEGQMKSSSNALVEKLTNGIDALLMRRCYEIDGVKPESGNEKLPRNLGEAITRYFGTEEDISRKRSEWSKQHLVVLAQGERKKPTITIIDRGEGQYPERIPHTIVGLNESIKEKINFVFGKYHQGGSAAIRFCGSKIECYQLVLSRRAESIAKIDGRTDNHWGFTLVRRGYKNRVPFYEYCVAKDGSIFSFPYSKPYKIEGAEIEFVDGCLIRLFDYYLESSSNITYGRNSLALDIDNKLQKSPLPIFLHELRSGYRGDTKYTIAGLLRRIADNSSIIADDVSFPAGLGEIGTRNIRCIRLKHIKDAEGVKSYKEQKEKIFYTENGLALGFELDTFLKSECKLTSLAPYLFCYIDMSDIPVELANIFHAGREELARTEDYQNLRERLMNFFEMDIFEKWDKEYEEKNIATANEDNRELDKMIEKAITEDPDLKELLGIGEEIKTPKGKEEEKDDYVGEDFPTKFELVGTQPKEIDDNSYSIVSFRTDAKDNLLTRRKERFIIEWTPSTVFDVVVRGMRKGILSLRVDCKDGTQVGDEDIISFTLKDKTGARKFSQDVTCKVISVPLYKGEIFPTKFELTTKKFKVHPKSSRKISFSTDAENDYFDREVDAGVIVFQERSDLQLKRKKLHDGTCEITLHCPLEEIGERPDIKLEIRDNSGNNFQFQIPFEVISAEETSRLNEPKRNPVSEANWPNMTPAWTESDIASVDQLRSGLVVNLNIDSKPLKELQKIVPSEKIDLARNKYLADVYIYSLYLFFELRNDPNRDTLLPAAMRAIGKALPGMIKKFI